MKLGPVRITFKAIQCYLAARITLLDRHGDDKAMLTVTWHRSNRWHAAQARAEAARRFQNLTPEAEQYVRVSRNDPFTS